jgi:hypothetical protein
MFRNYHVVYAIVEPSRRRQAKKIMDELCLAQDPDNERYTLVTLPPQLVDHTPKPEEAEIWRLSTMNPKHLGRTLRKALAIKDVTMNPKHYR